MILMNMKFVNFQFEDRMKKSDLILILPVVFVGAIILRVVGAGISFWMYFKTIKRTEKKIDDLMTDQSDIYD